MGLNQINGNPGTATQGGTPPIVGANILDGFASSPSTTSGILITIPAGRTWVGTLTITCAVSVTAAVATTGSATGTITTANGSGTVIPAAGTYARCDAIAAANVAGGLTGTDASEDVGPIPFVVQAPAAGTVTISYTITVAGASSAQVTCMCAGLLQ